MRPEAAPLIPAPFVPTSGYRLSGEGIAAALHSGRLAAEAIGASLTNGPAADRLGGLAGYQIAVDRELVPDIEVSRRLQAVFQRLPRPCVAVMRRSDRFWNTLCGLVRGELSYSEMRRSLGPLRFALDAASRVAGSTERA